MELPFPVEDNYVIKFCLSRLRFVKALVDQIEDESFARIGWHLGKCLLKGVHALGFGRLANEIAELRTHQFVRKRDEPVGAFFG